MVGFDPANDPGLSRIQYAIAGATSGVITRALIQPIDVVKIRFQVCSRCTKKTKVNSVSLVSKVNVGFEIFM